MSYTIKQVILVRTDLNMRKGKIAAQVAHASMKVFFDRHVPGATTLINNASALSIPLTPEMQQWVFGGFAKIVLGVPDEETLRRALGEAERRGIPCALIIDNGHTEFHGVHTATTVAIGPDLSTKIDEITGPNGIIPTKLL